MTPKNATTFKIIGILCLALCGVSSWYFLELSPSAQPKYTGASVASSDHSNKLKNILEFIKADPFKAFIGIVAIIGIAWAIYLLRNNPTIEERNTALFGHPSEPKVNLQDKANPDRQPKMGLVNYRAHLTAQLMPKIRAMIQGKGHHIK